MSDSFAGSWLSTLGGVQSL